MNDHRGALRLGVLRQTAVGLFRRGAEPNAVDGFAIRCTTALLARLPVDQRALRQDLKKTTIGPLSESRDFAMRYSSQVKPISYLKANAAEVLAQLAAQRQPLVITQNGEAKAVLQDVASFEQTQETLALLKILALGNQDVAAGKVKPASDVITRLRAKRTVA
jgi:prevent-host-death family protein